jgi:CO dehydrogenase nickel-insertion accessory protein CooC1
MESWRVVILGDGDAGKTALAAQVYLSFHSRSPRVLVIADLNISLVYA